MQRRFHTWRWSGRRNMHPAMNRIISASSMDVAERSAESDASESCVALLSDRLEVRAAPFDHERIAGLGGCVAAAGLDEARLAADDV